MQVMSLTGYTRRIAYDLVTREHNTTDVYFWDIASSAMLLWMFFEDVDFFYKEGSKTM